MPAFHPGYTTTLFVLSAAVLFAACGRDDSRENARTTTPSADAVQGKAGEVVTDVRRAAKDAADTLSVAAKDTAITTEVKARLANDSQLNALDIHVETSEGRVLLRGMTPDTGARSHAAEVAQAVAGVVDVRNDLSVQVLNR